MPKCSKPWCGAASTLECPCGTARYCGDEHADDDWGRHQSSCNDLVVPSVGLSSDNWMTVGESTVPLLYLGEPFAEILRREPEGPPLRWFGKEFNQVSGLLYFMQKFPNDCAPLTSVGVSGEEIIRENYILSSSSIEFFWDGLTLTEPEDFAAGIRHCLLKPRIRFIFSLLSMQLPANEGGALHANAILYDSRTHEVEVFEPQLGPPNSRIESNEKKFYGPMYRAVASAFGKAVKKKVTLYQPHEFCPVGPQTLSIRRLQVQDPGGFCAAWSLWWINARLENADAELTREQLIKSALAQFREMKNPTEFIRNYASYILEQRNELVREAVAEFNLRGDVERFLEAVAEKSARFNWLNGKLKPLRLKTRPTKREGGQLAEYEAEMKTLLTEMGRTLTLDDVSLRQYVLLGYEKRLREYAN